MTEIQIVVGAGALADRATADALIQRALSARGLTGGIVGTATGTDEVIVVPGLGIAAETEQFDSVVRVDFGPCRLDPSPRVRRHIRGRGLDGLRYAIDSVHFHRAHPAVTVAYGTHRDQRAELRLPDGEGPHPVAMLIHGGYWRSQWELDLMDAMAVDLTARGYATWNVEYRRPDEHGWDAMTADVAAALQALRFAAGNLDLDHVVVLGHSAGGHLALRLTADAVGCAVVPALAVSLAGVLDLQLADERWLSDGAVSRAIGGRYREVPEAYAASSPLSRLPIRVPHLIVCAVSDDPDLVEISHKYYRAASSLSDQVRQLTGPGDHFDVIDPGSVIWADIVDLMRDMLRAPEIGQ